MSIDKELDECFEIILKSEKVFDFLEKAKSDEIFLDKTLHTYDSLEKLQARLANCILYEVEQLILFHLDADDAFSEDEINKSKQRTGKLNEMVEC